MSNSTPAFNGNLMRESVELSALPATTMIIMSFLILKLKVPTIITAALQHLAAGIVLSAVAVELIPVINRAPEDQIWAIVVGFMLGIGCFLFLGWVLSMLEDDDEDDEDDEDEKKPDVEEAQNHSHTHHHPVLSKAVTAELGGREETRSRKQSKGAQARILEEMAQNIPPAGNGSPLKEPLSLNDHASYGALDSKQVLEKVPFPWMFACAVVIDAMVDGFLIGVSLSAGEKGGLVMAIALSIEMAFLGMTFAAAMRSQPAWIGVPAVIIPPVVLILGGVIGAVLAAQSGEGTWGNTMLVSFGVAALLYLVTEELLLEAHESLDEAGHDGGHVWWVDLCFFVGFLISLCLQKAQNASG